ncbi:hypothetical protein AAAC10_32880 [Pseudomonas aeruginosa]
MSSIRAKDRDAVIQSLRAGVVPRVRISEHRDRPFRLIVTGHFANA